MATFMEITNFLCEKLRSGVEIPRYLNYPVQNNGIVLKGSESGFYQDQLPFCEKQLKWKLLVLSNGQVVAISSATEFQLSLRGKTGWENGTKILGKYSQLYTNYRLGIKVQPLTTKIFEQLPEYLKEDTKSFWFADSYEINDAVRGLKCYSEGEIKSVFLNLSTGKDSTETHSIRLIAYLPKDIFVDIDDMKVNNGGIPELGIRMFKRPNMQVVHQEPFTNIVLSQMSPEDTQLLYRKLQTLKQYQYLVAQVTADIENMLCKYLK